MSERKERRLRAGRRRTVSPVCPESSSCFTCPLPDCSMDEPYNEILSDELYRKLFEE